MIQKNKIIVEFRRGSGNAHSGYSIEDRYLSRNYERREDVIRAFNECMTPYLHGDWERVEFVVNAE